MPSFKEDFKDIVDVDNVKVNCFGESPIKDFETIKRYGGFYRGSYLCYISLMSKVNPVNKKFMLAFESKATSRRFQHNQCKWFLVFKNAENQFGDLEILDREYANLVFGFDVDKFFETDCFKNCIELFKKTISDAIPQAKELIQKEKTTSDSIQASNCLMAIERGLAELDKPPVFEDGRRTYSTHDTEDPNKKYGAFNKDVLEKVLRNQAAREEQFKARQALKGKR